MQNLDSSCSEAELQLIFDAMDRNNNGSIEYEEFIEFVFSNEQVADLAIQELDLLHLAVNDHSRQGGGFSQDDADIAKVIEESRLEIESIQKMKERTRMDNDVAINRALELSATEQAGQAARRDKAKREEEEAEARLLEASVKQAKDEADKRARDQAAAEERELEAALKASELAAQEDLERKNKLHEEEDNSELFRAALRASTLDLGPRGVSQAAKVFATGDPSVGQPKAGFDTTTSGARGKRSRASVGAAPSFTGSESAASKAPVAGRADSPGSIKRKEEWAARTSKSAPQRATKCR